MIAWLRWLRLPPYAAHLLHRRCSWCWNDGWDRGYRRASYDFGQKAAEIQRERDNLWRAGIDPDRMESLRRAIARNERPAA